MRQKRSTIWMAVGDNNTEYFHRFATARKLNNALWGIKNSQGKLISRDRGLKELASEHFVGIYSKPSNTNLLSQLNVIKFSPRLFKDEDCAKIGVVISLEGVNHIKTYFLRIKFLVRMAGLSSSICTFFTYWALILLNPLMILEGHV